MGFHWGLFHPEISGVICAPTKMIGVFGAPLFGWPRGGSERCWVCKTHPKNCFLEPKKCLLGAQSWQKQTPWAGNPALAGIEAWIFSGSILYIYIYKIYIYTVYIYMYILLGVSFVQRYEVEAPTFVVAPWPVWSWAFFSIGFLWWRDWESSPGWVSFVSLVSRFFLAQKITPKGFPGAGPWAFLWTWSCFKLLKLLEVWDFFWGAIPCSYTGYQRKFSCSLKTSDINERWLVYHDNSFFVILKSWSNL